jgi:aspartate racemase
VDAAAAEYVEHIRAVQPSGPYHLLGWSLGGFIAHAVAARLSALGERVALLANLDSLPTETTGEFVDFDTSTESGALATVLDFVGHTPEDPAAAVPDFAGVTEILREKGNVLASFGKTRMLDFGVVLANNRRMTAGFRPPWFDGRVLLFVATAGKTDVAAALASGADAWRPYAGGGVQTHPLDCDHGEMADPGPLAEICRVVAQALSEPADSAQELEGATP